MFTNHFVCAGNEYSTVEVQVPAPYFRRNFLLKQNVTSAVIRICGLGFYELHINGVNITKGQLAPYRSNHDDYIYYDEYDIQKYLKRGNNVTAILLGNGMQNPWGGRVWDFDKAPWRSSPKVSFKIQIVYENGESELIVSDEQMKTAPSPILFDDLHWGEYYDARKEIAGWNEAEYDDSNWEYAMSASNPRGEERLAEVEPLRVRREIAPISVTPFENGYIYDFGVNTSGVCRLTIEGSSEGQKVLLQHCEVLVDGRPFLDSIRFHYMGYDDPFHEDAYFCKGEKKETYVPHFTYHGFRYVYVTGITQQQATSSLLTYLEICSDLETAGTFTCSDDIANQIQVATVRSDYSNFYYFPTDCPQREKNGWTADASLSAEQMLLNLHVETSLQEWMRNIYKAINDKGQLPGIIPTTGWGYEWGNGPAWDNVIVYIPYYVYKYRGNRTILEECATPLMRYLTYLHTRLNEKNLVEFGLGDWCQVKKIGADFDTPLVVTDTIMSIDIGRKAEFIYEVLGMKEHQNFAKALADKLTAAFREHLIDKESLVVNGDTQTAQAMAIYYGMFTEEETEKAYAHLLKQIQRDNDFMNVGVLGGRVLFRLLAEHGDADLAYYMITRPEFPSYGNWMLRGATTLWETFFEEGGRILSMNHHFWGDVSAWFYYYPAGIRMNPSARDVKHVDIVPCFIERLDSVSASYQSLEGKVQVSWERLDEAINLSISVPDAVYGSVKLPEGYQFQDGSLVCDLKSGVYTIKK